MNKIPRSLYKFQYVWYPENDQRTTSVLYSDYGKITGSASQQSLDLGLIEFPTDAFGRYRYNLTELSKSLLSI